MSDQDLDLNAAQAIAYAEQWATGAMHAPWSPLARPDVYTSAELPETAALIAEAARYESAMVARWVTLAGLYLSIESDRRNQDRQDVALRNAGLNEPTLLEASGVHPDLVLTVDEAAVVADILERTIASPHTGRLGPLYARLRRLSEPI